MIPSVDRTTAVLGRRSAVRRLSLVLAALAGVGACSMETPPIQGGEPASYIRLIQAVPNAPALTMLVDSTPVAAGLGYGAVTGFIQIDSGSRRIRLTSTNPASTMLDFALGVGFPKAYTVIPSGLIGGVQPIVADDSSQIPLAGEIKMRIINASPAISTVDVYVTAQAAVLDTVTPYIEDLAFRGNTEYRNFPSGRYRIRLTSPGTKTVLVDATILFGERSMRTIIAVDKPGGGLPATSLILTEY